MERKDPATDSSPNSELVIHNAQRLTELYLQQTKVSQFKRTLEECLDNQRQKIADLYVAYLPYIVMSDVKFLKGQYFRENDRFIRFQEVPQKYFTKDYKNYYFISHRWLSVANPDPNGAQFRLIQNLFEGLKPEVQDTWAFWYDYSCIPQRDDSGKRSAADEEKFQAVLKLMHLLPMLSSNVMIYDSPYLNRAWCSMEWMCATKISPRPVEDLPVPFFNHIKFRHMALLVLFLMKDAEFKYAFMKGDDMRAIVHLNALIYRSLQTCVSTIENDKNVITSLMYEHFYYHVRLLGFRTQLMIAFLTLENFDERTIMSIFGQFLVISEDPALKWTEETLFVAESVFRGIGNPTDMIFHRGEIIPKSTSSAEKLQFQNGQT